MKLATILNHRHFFRSSQTIEALKATCSMLEGQIEELEILNDELDERNVQLEIEK
jgi:hypothetical protein